MVTLEASADDSVFAQWNDPCNQEAEEGKREVEMERGREETYRQSVQLIAICYQHAACVMGWRKQGAPCAVC